METKFYVCGKPQGKARPRFSRKSGTVYTPTQTKKYEEFIAMKYRLAHGEKRKSFVFVDIMAIFPIPKSWSKRDRKEAARGAIFPGKPDVDNIIKVVLDALNGVAYDDDKQVIAVACQKGYQKDDEKPGLYVTVNGGN